MDKFFKKRLKPGDEGFEGFKGFNYEDLLFYTGLVVLLCMPLGIIILAIATALIYYHYRGVTK